MTAHAFGTHYRCRCGHAYGVDLGEHGCPKCEQRRPAKLVTPKPLVRKTPLVASSKPMRQFRKNRRPGNKPQTVAESAHIDRVKRAGCVCCIAQGYPHNPDGPRVEAHHLLSGGIRIGHGATVGLCQWHHRSRLIVQGWNHAQHREKLGPSLLEGSVTFHDHFGDDNALLQMAVDAVAALGDAA